MQKGQLNACQRVPYVRKPLAPCCKQKAVGCHLSATYLKCQCTLLQVWDFKTLKPEAALTGHGG